MTRSTAAKKAGGARGSSHASSPSITSNIPVLFVLVPVIPLVAPRTKRRDSVRALGEKGGTPAPTRDSSPPLETGDKSSISAAELSESQAHKVTSRVPSSHLLFFDELLGVRWRRVRACARRSWRTRACCCRSRGLEILFCTLL
jgi:hypothetical protein